MCDKRSVGKRSLGEISSKRMGGIASNFQETIWNTSKNITKQH